MVDCQANFLDDIGTRFAVPLIPRGSGPPPNPRLNPELEFNGERLILVVQMATSLRTSELRSRAGSLNDEHDRIIGAIDVLIGTA